MHINANVVIDGIKECLFLLVLV